jgi:parallel beta-helix repeat protein
MSQPTGSLKNSYYKKKPLKRTFRFKMNISLTGELLRKGRWLCCFMILWFSHSGGQVVINEFLARNVSTIADPDFGRFSDFIELYNPSGEPVNLEGYSITDNPGNPAKWVFPSITINPGGYLLLWANGQDKIINDRAFSEFLGREITVTSYHLNFSLSRDGEYVGLFDSQGNLLDEIYFGNQLADISYGRNPDSAGQWLYFGHATPGAGNSAYGATSLAFAPEPVFSIQGGFYSPGECILNIGTDMPGAEVRFTEDGSDPDESSPIFTGNIAINRTTTVKARVYIRGMLPGEVETHTYFIGQNINMPVISISTGHSNLWGHPYGLFLPHDAAIRGREVPVAIEYFDESGERGFSHQAGIRIFGSTIYNLPQRPVSVRFRSRYGESPLIYPLFGDRENQSYNSFMLRNGGNDHNLSFFRDGLAVALVKNKMDIDYQDYKPCVVFINGEYWGIYEIRERTEASHFGHTHNVNADALDILEDSLQVSAGSADHYERLLTYIESNNLSDNTSYDHVASQIDINEYINYMIHKIFVGYVIFQYNNKYWRERGRSGKWRWLANDLEHGFGSQLSGHDYWENTLADVSGRTGSLPGWTTFLFENLLKNQRFRDEFTQRFASYLNTIYRPEVTIAATDSLQALFMQQMPRHINRWGTPHSMQSWSMNVNFIKEFLLNRPVHMREHLADAFGVTDSIRVSLCITGKGKVSVAGVWFSGPCNAGYYFGGAGLPLYAVPETGYRFAGWEGFPGNGEHLTLDLVRDTIITAVFEPWPASIIPPEILSDTMLTAALSPWHGVSDVIIHPGATLFVEPGAELLMADRVSVYVHGSLKIWGEMNDSVIIRPDPSPSARVPWFSTSPRWGVICAENATDTVTIRFASISGSGFGHDRSKMFASVTSLSSDIVIENTRITDNIQPFYSEYGSVYIGHSKFRCDLTCDLINVKYSENAIVEYCDLRGNNAYDTDAIDFDGVINGIIRHNVIYGFLAENSDGIDLGEGSQNILIENNIIFDCYDKGISIGQGSTAIIRRNLIFDCDMGIAVKDEGSFALIDQNTIAFCNFAVACYEKNPGRGGGHAEIKNTILSGSFRSPLLIDGLSGIEVSWSLSDTDELPGSNNLLDDPMFINAPRGNFELRPGSPCIDAGDPASEPDPDGSRADIGALYVHAGEVNMTVTINEINYRPAANYDTGDWIEIRNSGDSPVNIMDWQVRNRQRKYIIHDEIVLQPGDYLVICRDTALFRQFHPDVRNITGNLGYALGNRSGQIRIMDGGNLPLHSVIYSDSWPFPPLADGLGATIELEHDRDGNSADHWRESYILMGTPGRPNSTPPLFENIYINEFMASNRNTIADEYGEYDDWFEVYNDNDTPVNIAGLYFTDRFSDPRRWQVPLNAPEITEIGPKGFLILWADGQPEQGPLHADFRLNAAGEEIAMFQRINDGFIRLDGVAFGQQSNRESFGRLPDGIGQWVFMTPTPGYSNRLTSTEDPIPPRIKIYPNPFDRFAVLELMNIAKPYDLLVTDITGRPVLRRTRLFDDEFILQGSLFAPGTYIYRVISADGDPFSGKFVVY